MTRKNPKATILWTLFLLIAAGLTVALPATEAVPAKLAALFPKNATDLTCSNLLRLQFMMGAFCTASLPATRSCNRGKVTPSALKMEIKSFNTQDEVGKMQAEMTGMSSEMEKHVRSMRKELESRRDYRKNLGGQITEIREEKVGSGTLLMFGFEKICVDVNPDSPSYREVVLRAYFHNGRTEALVEFENQCSEADARAVIAHLFDRIEKTDFTDLM